MDWQVVLAERDNDCLGAIVTDSTLTIEAVSNGVLEISGYERQDLIGKSAIDIVHPDDLLRAAEVLAELREIPGERPDGMYRLVLNDGTSSHYTVRANNYGPDGAGKMVFEFRTPTPQMRSEAFADDVVDVMRMLSEDLSLEDSLDWVARVAERHVEGLQVVITTFAEGDENRVVSRHAVPDAIARANAAASPDRLPAHVQNAVDQLSDRAWRSSRKIAALDSQVPERLTSILVDRSGGLVGYVEAFRPDAAPPTDSEWLVHGMISRMMTAVLRRNELDAQLRSAADLDPLTGLVNRRRLFELLASTTDLAGSHLYLIDLDRFSWINNNLGHSVGDEALIAVAKSLTESCPDQAVVARLGGDEFVVWMPSPASVDELRALGESMSSTLVVPVRSGDRRVLLRCSIGMTRINEGELASEALKRADEAMYVSKRQGGDAATIG